MVTSLLALPTETVIAIFKVCDDFASATALARSSRFFNTIWKADVKNIFTHIQARTVPEPDPLQANSVFDAYEQVLRLRNPYATFGSDSMRLEVTTKLAFLALDFLKAFEKRLCKVEYKGTLKGLTCPVVSKPERKIFIKAVFNAFEAMIVLSHEQMAARLKYFFATLNVLEYAQMLAIIIWIHESRMLNTTIVSEIFRNLPSGFGRNDFAEAISFLRWQSTSIMCIPYQPFWNNIFPPFVKGKYRLLQIEKWKSQRIL